MFPAVYNQTFSPLALNRSLNNKPFIFGPISAHFYKRPADEKILTPITAKLHQKTIARATQLITITKQVKTLYQNTHKPITVIPLGVDTNQFKPTTKTPSTENLQILYAGALYPLKGVEHLIQAFSIVAKQQPKARLKIIGTGPQETSLKHLAKTLKLETKVTFQNFIPHTQIAQHIQNCTILCFPSLGEPFGKTIIEAMSCAKPVIATNIGGAKEIITDNVTGILVPPAQPKILAQKILQLLNTPEKMTQIGKNARKTTETTYSWETIAEKYHKLYQSLA
jgi:glycosyltransferase involved in cell wall biosynthesis